MASKSVWNLPGGPWERLFGGLWNQFNVAVYENPDKTILTTVFPKSGEVNWIMIRVDKIMIVPRGIEKIEGQLRNKSMHILKQQLPGNNTTYLILLSPPTTVEFGSKEIGSIVFQKTMALAKEAEDIKAIAKMAKIEATDIKDASYKDSANVLGNPTLLLSLLSVAPQGEEPKRERIKEITLGDSEEGVFKVDETMFNGFVSVKRGTEEERNYLAQVILENALMDISPIPIILDYSKHAIKLDQSNPYPYDYSQYGMETNNVGFKVEGYDLASETCPIRINLNKSTPQIVWQLFGLGTDEASTLILQAVSNLQQEGMIKGIESIEQELKGMPAETDNAKAIIARAVRMTRAIKLAYSGIISKDSDLLERILDWVKGNKTVHIDMSGLGNRERLALTLYLIESIKLIRESKKISELERKRIDHIFLSFIGLDWFGKGLMQSEIMERVIADFKGGLFVGEGELPMEIESRVSHRFQITGPGTAKLYLGGRGKDFRVRPLLSCPP